MMIMDWIDCDPTITKRVMTAVSTNITLFTITNPQITLVHYLTTIKLTTKERFPEIKY